MDPVPSPINPTHQPSLEAFARLLTIMDELREKCPWDREQTWESLRILTLEEVYELSEAILSGNDGERSKELGDVLLHIVFYAKLGNETGAFTLADVINRLNEKLIRRHPHIYGNVSVTGSEEVKANWEQIKLGEGAKSVLSGVPASLPALIKAYRMQEKAKGVGFDFATTEDSKHKVEEELTELAQAVEGKNMAQVEDEFGDVLFSLVNYARFLGINPEDALERSNRRFKQRFTHMEEATIAAGQQLNKLTPAELDQAWETAKRELAKLQN